MNDSIIVAIIGAGSMLTGVVITALVNRYLYRNKKKDEHLRAMILQAYKDIAAFYRLEEIYIEVVSGKERSAESVKRFYRKRLRAQGFASPSESATLANAIKRINQYSDH